MAQDRISTVRTPVGDKLTFTRMTGTEELSRCFAWTVSFVSEDADIDPLKIVGKPISVEADADAGRWFSGIASQFRLRRIEDRIAHYDAVVRPWLWFLSTTTDCRIFQQMSVVEIIEEIFSKYGIAKFEKRLQASYKPVEYCVQYDESDLDFVQRLMEHEGIWYFFEHGDDEHTLVLVDSMSALKPVKNYASVPYFVDSLGSPKDMEHIREWVPTTSLRAGAYAHTDYDFKKPSTDLMAQSVEGFPHPLAEGENYRHPGAHLDVGRGDALALIRREELQAPHRRIVAAGDPRGLISGCTFKLEGFPREDQNDEYLVVSAEYAIANPGHHLDDPDESARIYRVTMTVAPTSVPFRPERSTRRPIMRGPQTATVVGPSGEEIFTDEFARVKVQFHWDRLGKKDQNSSCFVRVSQTWAGAGWGFIQIPRIGQEVIVDFIEGDPDRPIITGRVYNANEMPPYALPGNATQSGLKTNSSPGGGGWNELRFEDKAGSEEVYFQAQKDHNLLIKNDRSKLVQHDQSDRIDNNAKHSVGVNLDEDVGNNKTTKVGVDRTVTIGSNDTETVGSNRSLTVGANETISIGSNSTETIGASHTQTVAIVQTITVGAARVDTVGASEARTVGASRSVTVGASQSHSVGQNDSWTVGKDQTVDIGKDQTVTIGDNATLTVGKTRTTKIGKDESTEIGASSAIKIAKGSLIEVGEDGAIKIGKDLLITAGDSLVLKCGSAAIALKKDGTINITGKDITVSGSGKVNVKASSDITMKGSKINQN